MPMKIKTLLHISFAILIITVIVIGSGVMMTAQQVREAIANNQVADKIVRDVFLLNLLTNDYLLDQGSRARTPWESKFDSLTRVLDSATFRHPDELSRFDAVLGYAQVAAAVVPVFWFIGIQFRFSFRPEEFIYDISACR